MRARRIRQIEAEQRAHQRLKGHTEQLLDMWVRIDDPSLITRQDGQPTTPAERVAYVLKGDPTSKCFPLSEFPRDLPASQDEGWQSLYVALNGGIVTPEQATRIATESHQVTIARQVRWIAHLENRLTYERAMLEEQGAAGLLAPKTPPKPLPLCNYRAPEGLAIPNPYQKEERLFHPQIEMTAAEYARIHKDYKATRIVDGSHRVRTAMRESRLVCVFLIDAKKHNRPAPAPVEKK